MDFESELKSYTDDDCIDYSDRLGIVKIPEDYALLLNRDRTHFFYIKAGGVESCIHWNKWAVYRWIKEDSLKISDCGCRFESDKSNAILLCEECGKLPCHSREHA